MKRGFNDPLVREAVGRILRDSSFAGDGFLLLQALEGVREGVPGRLPEACALQAEWGKRKLAHDLIEIAREEYERVTQNGSPASLRSPGPSGSGSDSGGNSPGASLTESSGHSSRIAIGAIATRRRGPAASYTPDE